MFGVLVNAHVIKFVGAVVVADAFHECGGLRFVAFGLFAGDGSRRHREQYGAGLGGQMDEGNAGRPILGV
jgi:hypothetical protein